MNEILGILIPLLMKGSGIVDIFRAFTSVGSGGAASSDGLLSMMSRQAQNIVSEHPARPDPKTITRAADRIVDLLGVIPTSGIGQAMSSGIGAMYNIAPDIMGGILGIPDSDRFFGMLANGAPTISAAAGFGSPDIFSPYSMLEAHKHTMKMANQVYEMGTKKGGGYNIEFSHGLNMNEIGTMTQRLLSSSIPYRRYSENKSGEPVFSEDTGERLNLSDEQDAEKFRKNLKTLGSKFNETASMLAKITGSVEEAINLMDRIGGGNFLGGSAEHASAVANKARDMAAGIRITSAMAGISPRAAYAAMLGTSDSIARGMGVDSNIASVSGFTGAMTDMAYAGTMGYTTWAAMHPNATQQEKDQMMMVSRGRTEAYATSSAANLGAAIAANSNLFTADQLQQVKRAYREGRANDVFEMARGVIGAGNLDAMMSDPATMVATRRQAYETNPDLLRDIDVSGIEGNYAEAEKHGFEMRKARTMSDLDQNLSRLTGNHDSYKAREDARKDYLKGLAKKHLGLTDSGMKDMSADAIESALREIPSMDVEELDRGMGMAEIKAAKNHIASLTMTKGEEASAKERLSGEISSSESISAERKDKLLKMIESGVDLATISKEFTVNMNYLEKEKHNKEIFGGKITSGQANLELAKISDLEKSKSDFTTDERLAAIKNDIARSNVVGAGELDSIYSGKDFGSKSDRDAMADFAKRVNDLDRKGMVSLGYEGSEGGEGRKGLDKTYAEAAERMLSDSNVLGDFIGDMKGDDFKKFIAKKSEEMVEGVKEGKSFAESFASVFGKDNISKEDQAKIGKGGMEYLARLVGEAGDETSDLRTKFLGKRAFFSAASGVIKENSSGNRMDLVGELGKLASGDFGDAKNDAEATNRFLGVARDIGILEDGNAGGGFAEFQKSKMEGFLKSAYGDKLSERQRRQISAGAMKAYAGEGEDAGDYAKSIAKAAKEAGIEIDDSKLKDIKSWMSDGSKGYASELQKSGVESFLESAYGDKLSERQRRQISAGAMKAYAGEGEDAGDYAKSIAKAAKEAGIEIDESKLEGAGAGVLQGMLAKVQPKGTRVDNYSAAIAAADANGSMVNWSAANFVRTGGGMVPANFKADVLSAVDDINADASQNRIVKALGGNASYYKEAISQTKSKITELGSVLGKAGVTSDDIKALGGNDEEKKKTAEDKVKGALKGRIDSKFELGMVQTLGESGRKIGGTDAVDVLFGGKKAMDAAMKQKGAGEDMLDITRESNKKDSELAQIVEKITSFTATFGRFMKSDSVKVSVINGDELNAKLKG